MKTVLIVEDDLSLQSLYEMILNVFGFKILGIYSNGKEAIDGFIELNEKPDVIIMDYRMPVKNGIETTIEILSLDSNSKILFASADKSVKEKALKLGVASFIEKPFSLEILKEEIIKICNGV